MGFAGVIKEFGVKLTLAFDSKKAEEASKAIDKLESNMKSLALSTTGAIAAILGFANVAGVHARTLQNNATMLGLNVEKLQEMEYAARTVAGVGREELVGSFQQVAQTIDQFRHGNVEAGQGLLRLAQAGIGEQKMLQLLTDKYTTVDKVVEALSESFKNIKDPMAAVRLATEAGGGSMAKLLPLLKQGADGWKKYGAEARASGLVDSSKTIASAAKMEEEMVKLWQILEHISYTIGYELLKYLKPMILQFEKWVQTNKKLIAANIVGVMKGLGAALMVVFKVGKLVGEAILSIVDIMGGAENATKALLAVFLLFRTITFFTALAQSLTAISGVIGFLVTAFGTLGTVFSALSIASFIPDLALLSEVFMALGGIISTALLPLLPWIAGIGAIVVAVHDLWALMNNEPTWTGKAVEKAKGMFDSAKGWMSEKAEQVSHLSVSGGAIPAVTPSGINPASTMITNQNTYNSTSNVSVPAGTTPKAAAKMIENAHTDAHDKMVRKSQADSTRSRVY